MQRMKPIISYYGGKQRIAARIVEVVQGIAHTAIIGRGVPCLLAQAIGEMLINRIISQAQE